MIHITHRDFVPAVFAYQAHVVRVLGDVYGVHRLVPDERIVRYVEETAELAQAHGLTREQTKAIVDYVFDRPPDAIHPEIGGCLNTLLAYASSQKVSAGAWAEETLRLVEARRDHYRLKDQTKHR